MKTKIAIVLILSFYFSIPTIAADIYRWTDPETGKVLVTPNLPPYPVKEKRNAGRLPNSDLIELTFDPNAPAVKSAIEKRKAKEAEEKRIAEEKQRERAVREVEQRRIAEIKEKEQAELEAQEKTNTIQEVEKNRINPPTTRYSSTTPRFSSDEWEQFRNSSKPTDVLVKSCSAQAGILLSPSYVPSKEKWMSMLRCVDVGLGK